MAHAERDLVLALLMCLPLGLLGCPNAPVAAFNANLLSGQIPLAVQFVDLSIQGSNTLERWDWSFGDSFTSNEQNPTHIYTKPGRYTVSLTVRSNAGTDTESKTNLIDAYASYLGERMDIFQRTFDVYTDADAAGNHFPARGRMWGYGLEESIPVMDEACTCSPHSGVNCIRADFISEGNNWGGWYFMNGTLQGDEVGPSLNWGNVCSAGLDLTGATKLTFWARGARGGEQVEFFCLGVGRDSDTCMPVCQPGLCCPESACKATTGYITLGEEWHEYEMSLVGLDLSYVLGGFGWATNAQKNNKRDITFYLDDIQYDESTTDMAHFIVSYETLGNGNSFDTVMRNVAFTYDNAMVLLAFIARGDIHHAELLADAFVYAQKHDRWFSDGRLRNAYQGGDLILWPGWTPHGKSGTARIPGWYDAGHEHWYEDSSQVGTSAGNVAWAMIALLAYYASNSDSKYLAAVEDMAGWIEQECYDTRGAGGYTAGYEGWEPDQTKLTYKATEHNIDLYASFLRLFQITGNSHWNDAAQHAKGFVQAMWDAEEGKFWTGTSTDGATVNKEVIPLDIQVWALLALRQEGTAYRAGLNYVESHHRFEDGYDFNGLTGDQTPDGVWFEGTGQVACAYYYVNEAEKADTIVSFLLRSMLPSGALPAASKDGLTTGFVLSDGKPWLYYDRPHVAATAWGILAQAHGNPFWLDVSR